MFKKPSCMPASHIHTKKKTQCFTCHRTFSMINDKNEKMKKRAHVFSCPLTILEAKYFTCVLQ